FGLATALRRQGKTGEAREALAKFESVHRAEAARLRKVDSLTQACLRAPRDAAAAEALARFSLESGDLDACEQHAWRAIRIEPGRTGARLALARALARGGRYGAAAVQYQRILRADSSHAEARQEL